MELCLGSDVYVMTLCICIQLGSSLIKIIFILLLQLILKNAVLVTTFQIIGDMKSTGGDNSENTAEKCHNGGGRQYNTAGSNTSTAVMDRLQRRIVH